MTRRKWKPVTFEFVRISDLFVDVLGGPRGTMHLVDEDTLCITWPDGRPGGAVRVLSSYRWE
jgi:predicted RNA-binding protein associated with RNAse of E/G family